VKHEEDVPRERLIGTAVDLLRRRGLSSTSIRELAKHANAPLGSTYHYFPAGKPQLISEAVTQSGRHVSGLLNKALAEGPVAGLEAFLTNWRSILRDSEFKAGCPVIAVAADDSSGEGEGLPLAAAAEALREWERLISQGLAEAGMEEPEASAMATFIIASVEGAILLCRAVRSITPFDNVAKLLTSQLRAQTSRGTRARGAGKRSARIVR
jgi:AcrR family transcriptional regulator